jgi:hypothetical protein
VGEGEGEWSDHWTCEPESESCDSWRKIKTKVSIRELLC